MTKLPHFLLIGAAKSGTISLHHYLNQHPQIFMGRQNETNYLALAGLDPDANFNGPNDREVIERYFITELAEYSALFTAATPTQKIGEVSPGYLYIPETITQIQAHIPQAKLIAILRHPADRAFSHYQHFRRGGLEPLPDFRQALSAEAERIKQGWGPVPYWHYLQMGFYGRQLQRYYDHFPRDQIKLFLFEELQAEPTAVLGQIFTFLDVDPDFVPDLSVRHNVGGQAKSQNLRALMTQPNPLKSLLNRLLPTSWRHRLRDRLHRANTVKLTLDPVLRRELIQTYQEDILLLQKLSGRDLSHWLT